jgi:hypothetical protein
MRHVVEISTVAHLWAHQMQDHARNSGGNFYFEGADIHSYGSHFRCGSVSKNKAGETAYLITTRTYSNTTSKHMSYVNGAIPSGALRFDTDRIPRLKGCGRLGKYDHQETLFYIIDQLGIIDEAVKKQIKSKTTDYRHTAVRALINIGRWIKFWGLDKRQQSDREEWLSPAIPKLLSTCKADKEFFWQVRHTNSGYYNAYKTDESALQKLLILIDKAGLIPNSATDEFREQVEQLFVDWSGDTLIWEKFDIRYEKQAEITARTLETRERNKEIRREQERKEREDEARIRRLSLEERIEKWRTGELATTWIDIGYDLTYNAILRVRKGRIETSKGIAIKVSEAKRLWPLIERFHENETTFVSDRVRDVSDNLWSINSYKNDILTSGCHRLTYKEMRDCMVQLGVAA